MGGYVFAAHLIDFEASCLRRSGGVLHSGGTHPRPIDNPLSVGHQPLKGAILLHKVGEVHYLVGLHDDAALQRLGLSGPHILVPHWQRALEHLAQRLLLVALYAGLVAQRHAEVSGLSASVQGEPDILRRCIGQAQRNRCQGVETYVEIHIGAVEVLYTQLLVLAIYQCLDDSIHKQVALCLEKNAAQGDRLGQMKLTG